jgi:hypothetical protein
MLQMLGTPINMSTKRKFVALWYSRIFKNIKYQYDNLLEKLNLQMWSL